MGDFEPLAFSYKSTKRLITMVQERPCLWDRQAADYKDRLARDRAWSEIFMEMDAAYKDGSATQRHEIGLSITKKWYNIRDSYAKSLKPDYFGRRNRPYIHADLLGFLDDCYLNKISNNFLDKLRKREAQEPADETEELDGEAESWEHKVFVNLDEGEPLAKKRREHTPEQSYNETKKDDEDIISVLSNLIQKEEDEDRAFFKSITPSVKKLSEDSKLTFRIEVLQLLKKLRAKDETKVRSIANEDPVASGNDSESD